jgi:hypothetical protein
MDGHPPHRRGWIMERNLPKRGKTGVGSMMIHERSACSSHAQIRVRQAPDRRGESSLAMRRQSVLGLGGCCTVSSAQLLHKNT